MNRKSTLKTLFSYLRPYGVYLAFSLVLALITVGLTLYVPILTGEAVDKIIGAVYPIFGALLIRGLSRHLRYYRKNLYCRSFNRRSAMDYESFQQQADLRHGAGYPPGRFWENIDLALEIS